MSFAFVGHSYHAITLSTRWFIEILQREEQTTLFWDEEWQGGKALNLDEILSYDKIFVFQPEGIAAELAKRSPAKLVFLPMWDSARNRRDEWWGAFSRSRILNLSWHLHQSLRQLDLDSYHGQYFPNPNDFDQVTDFSSCRGFLWQRRAEVRWHDIMKLSEGTEWSAFHLHVGMDPGEKNCELFNDFAKQKNARITHFKTVMEADACPDDANIYFAPRAAEGIGMAFLEAMARGQCVVAIRAPTMSEYIEHGVNGLLYDPPTKKPLDFSAREGLGNAARQSVEHGFSRWQQDLNCRIPQILFSKTDRPIPRIFERSWRKAGVTAASITTDSPRLSVVIIVRDAGAKVLETLDSTVAQVFENLEIIILDVSEDGSAENIIQDRRCEIAQVLSKPHTPPFAAISRVAELARGEFLIVVEAGSSFASSTALSIALDKSPAAADIIYGHQILVLPSGQEYRMPAAAFEQSRRCTGRDDVSVSWFNHLPSPQATFVRRQLLLMEGYDAENFPLLADKEFLFREFTKGRRFHHCGDTIIVCAAPTWSTDQDRELSKEWRSIAERNDCPKLSEQFFHSVSDVKFSHPGGPRRKTGVSAALSEANRSRKRLQRRLTNLIGKSRS